MRHLLHPVLVLALCLGLSGCFVSKVPLIMPDEAAFPYDRIVFQVADRSDETQILQREGDTYRLTSPDTPERSALIRLKAAGNGTWVAQISPPPEADEDEMPYLYALLVAGDGMADVSAYAAVQPDDFTARDGLTVCQTGVCIGDLDAYVAYALARVAAGVPPDTVYRLLELD